MKRELCRYCRKPLATKEDVERESDEPGLCWSIVDYCETDAETAIDAHLATIARLEQELEKKADANEDMRDLLREVYNLTRLERDCPIDLPHRALVHIGHLIEEKTPPP